MAYGLKVWDGSGTVLLDTTISTLRLAKRVDVSQSSGGSTYTYYVGHGVTSSNSYIISPKDPDSDLAEAMEQMDDSMTEMSITMYIDTSQNLKVDTNKWPSSWPVHITAYVFFQG